ncbi:MAG: hypothetical protein M3Z30_02760 [Gemmatimonadota bacterium]|nr:hypothetical protein [Gemmatimonadota bacterium]
MTRRIARVIPNPIIRFAIVTIGTAVVPILADKISERWHARRRFIALPSEGVRTDA